MTSLAHSDGMTMMVVTHEMGFARRAADTVIFMDEGEIIERNASEAFFTAPQTDRARGFLSKILTH
jgi:ABC-type polar amino acid transport system ATPase subunit